MNFEFGKNIFSVSGSNEILSFFTKRFNITGKKTLINKLIFEDDKTIIKSSHYKQIFNEQVQTTDLYQIINNYLSSLTKKNELLIHGVVISKSNKGFLILGNFGQGKSYLACKAKEYGYDINSTDISLLSINNGKLFLKYGSYYMKEDSSTEYEINEIKNQQNVEIIEIVMLYGMCDNGLFSKNIIDEKYFVKRIFPFISWHYNVPLKTNFSYRLFNLYEKNCEFLAKLNYIKTVAVRGDCLDIISFFDNELKRNDDDTAFKNALISYSYDNIKKCLLSDTHVHGVLGSDPKLLGILPKDKYNGYDDFKASIKEYVKYSNKNEYLNYIKKTIETSINNGVKLLELSIDFRDCMKFDNLIKNLNELKIHYNYVNKIKIRFDLGISQTIDTKEFDNIKKLISKRFFSGIDLYGDERKTDYNKFIDIYNYAAKFHMIRKVHIGEILSNDSISRSMVLNPTVIQHGLTVIKENNLSKYKNIKFNVCVTSNIKLGYFKNLREHPVRIMFDLGLNITLNTDDQLLFDSSIIDEYLLLFKNNIFTAEELNIIRKNGVY